MLVVSELFDPLTYILEAMSFNIAPVVNALQLHVYMYFTEFT